MSRPTDSLIGPLAYAPKWVRDAAIAKRRNAARQHRVSIRNEGLAFGSPRAETNSTDDAWPTEWSRARSLEPVVLPSPPSRSRLQVRFAIAGALAISAVSVAIAALYVMGRLPTWGVVATDDSLGAASFETRFTGEKYQTSNFDLLSHASQLARVSIARQRENQGLGEAAADHVPSAATGGAGATAPVNQAALLAEPLRSTAEQVTAPTSPTPRALNPDEIAAFLKRGQQLMASGDIAAARVLLLRAAEARDPEAALALAATFDPIMLGKIGAYGVIPDVSSARRWYEKAKEFGSKEAPPRLDMLARRER